MSRYGDALIERREMREYATASDLAKKSKQVADQLQNPQLAAFSQQTLSRLEGDKTGELIANARPRIQRMLSYLLGWSAEEFEAKVGVSIPAVPNFPNSTSLPPARPSPDLPQGLQEMIRLNSERYPDLLLPHWQRFLARIRFRNGITPDAQKYLNAYKDMLLNDIEPPEDE